MVEEKAKKETSMKQVASLVRCLAYSSTMKMEATLSSEISVDFQRTTWHYFLADRTLHNHCCENLKSYMILLLLLNISVTISIIIITVINIIISIHIKRSLAHCCQCNPIKSF
jgi:hypothetical protein